MLIKKYRSTTILFILLFIITVFSNHNYFFYHSTIGKVKKISLPQTNTESLQSENSKKISTQILTLEIMNGKYKGESFSIKNQFHFSSIDTTKYRKGDDLFLSLSAHSNNLSGTIIGVKRDKYVVLLSCILVFLCILIAKKRGLLSVLSLTINIILFSIAIKLYNTGINLFELCSILAVVFTIITLLILNGINKRTFAAICSTLLTLLFTILIFLGASKVGEPLDYSVLDYIYATDDLEYIFFSGVLLAGLGAVMDVSVSITSAMNELVVKNPSISLVDMFKSSREISHDIMGAMINVLLFTYI